MSEVEIFWVCLMLEACLQSLIPDTGSLLRSTNLWGDKESMLTQTPLTTCCERLKWPSDITRRHDCPLYVWPSV